jgi:thermostable 8-oxoguanine DNA glycosylase
MTTYPKYKKFTDKSKVLLLEQQYLNDISEYPDEKALTAGQAILAYENLQENAQTIFRWKLQSYWKRNFRWMKEFSEIFENQLLPAMDAAIHADDDEPRTVIQALRVLDDLRGVGIPVASAFLTAINPYKFTVIDRRAYEALEAVFPNSPSKDEYISYLNFCRAEAVRLGVPLRAYDRALWQKGGKDRRNRKHRDACHEGADTASTPLGLPENELRNSARIWCKASSASRI